MNEEKIISILKNINDDIFIIKNNNKRLRDFLLKIVDIYKELYFLRDIKNEVNLIKIVIKNSNWITFKVIMFIRIIDSYLENKENKFKNDLRLCTIEYMKRENVNLNDILNLLEIDVSKEDDLYLNYEYNITNIVNKLASYIFIDVNKLKDYYLLNFIKELVKTN